MIRLTREEQRWVREWGEDFLVGELDCDDYLEQVERLVQQHRVVAKFHRQLNEDVVLR